jgi:hypothetical protein
MVLKTAVLPLAFFLFMFFGCSKKASETEASPDVPEPGVFSLNNVDAYVLSGDMAGDKREEIFLVDGRAALLVVWKQGNVPPCTPAGLTISP